MATEVTHIVDPGEGTGHDYHSLKLWEAGEQGDLTGARDEIAIAKCRATDGDADVFDGNTNINGWVTSATQYIKIWTDPSESYRHAGVWNDTKYRLTGAGNLVILEANVRIDGLQITRTSDSGWNNYICFWCDGEVCDRRISNCIIKDLVGADSSIGITDDLENPSAGSKIRIWNTIVYDFTGGSWSTGISCGDPNNTWYLYNVTVQNCRRGISVNNLVPVVCKNVIVQDCGSSGFIGTFDATSTNNCSDDNTQPGDSGRNGEVLFLNEDGDDFHLNLTDTVALDYGVSDPGSGLFSDDIDGVTRSGTWDIGADEYVAAGIKIPVAMYHYQQAGGL